VRWHQASRLSAREWLDVLGAQSRLIRAQLCVISGRVPSLTPLATGVTRGRHLDDRWPLRGESARTRERAEALARAVERATHYGVIRPRPRCLARSLALLHALHTAGIEGARLRIGSERTESHTGGRIGPHAWIELNGRPIGDSHQAGGVATGSP
jgi:hypothetical protein